MRGDVHVLLNSFTSSRFMQHIIHVLYALQHELDVPLDSASPPILLSLIPQLKRNVSSLKPPEAAAFAAVLVKRKELDQ